MSFPMLVTYFMIDAFCIIMACVMGAHLTSDFGSEFEVKALRKSLAAYCSFLVFGLLCLSMQNGVLTYRVSTAYLTNGLSLFFINFTVFYWFVFAMAKLSRGRAFAGKWLYALSAAPMVLTAVICLATPWTGWGYTFTVGGQYRRGPLFIVLAMISYLYDLIVCVYAISCALQEKQAERRKLCWVMGLYIVFPMGAGLVQLRVAGTPIMAPAIMVALFLVFVTIQSSQIYNDALTGLNNRKRAYAYLERELAAAGKDHPVAVYIMDVDDFKQVNDQQGHVEGDRALTILAEALRRLAVKESLMVARYGGDEFLMVSGTRSTTPPEAVAEALHRQLQMLCIERDLPYALTVSVGYVTVTERTITAAEAVQQADQRLYEAKTRYHAGR